MEIQQTNFEKAGKFFGEKDGKEVAIMNYTWREDGNMVIEHTQVDPSLKGQGIGRQLVSAAVDQARKHNFKIKSNCPYAANVLQKTESFKEVVLEA